MRLSTAQERKDIYPSPIWKETSRVLHFRSYEIEDIVSLGERSSVTLFSKKTHLGDKEVAECTKEDRKTALERAKARAHGPTANKSPTLQIQIIVGRGKGRTTREFELIWWPEMFSTSKHGKLTLRFYVSRGKF